METSLRLDALREFKAKYSNAELSKAITSNTEVKRELNELSLLLLKKPLNGCGNCHADTLIELLLLDKKQVKKMEEIEYRLNAGAVLHDSVNFDRAKMATAKNLTTELALFHLAQNSNKIKHFSLYPPNWEQLVEEYKASLTVTPPAEDVTPPAEDDDEILQEAILGLRNIEDLGTLEDASLRQLAATLRLKFPANIKKETLQKRVEEYKASLTGQDKVKKPMKLTPFKNHF